MKTRIQPDPEMAASLRRLATITLQRLESTEKLAFPSNTVSDYYDILHKLMEAIAVERGLKFSGDGAHQQLIDHVAKDMALLEEERLFLQELREYRNRISYEGFSVQPFYITRTEPIVVTMIRRLS
jgi:hypothetical protein